MVLWSVSTALSVCQFEEVPAVGPYVWEREQENEESILHHVLSHSPCVVSSSFIWPLPGFVFSLLLMLHESVTERLTKSSIFFFRSPVFMVQHYLFFCCLRRVHILLFYFLSHVKASFSLVASLSVGQFQYHRYNLNEILDIIKQISNKYLSLDRKEIELEIIKTCGHFLMPMTI